MRKFPKIRYPNDPETDGLHNGEVVVTEKLDGANFRFTWGNSGELHIGTRNVTYDDAVNNENLPKGFEHAVEYIRNVQWTGMPHDLTDITFFGEAMHLHSLDYDDIDWHKPSSGASHVPLDSEHPNVVLFDAARDGDWLDWDKFREIVSHSPFEHTPVLERGNPEELSFDVPEESMFGGPPEGIVARRVDGSVRAKKVTEEFKETNAVAFEEPSKAQSDAAEFVAAYVTDARIVDVAHSLVDEGQYDALTMEMMADLPREVLRDAMAENAWDLLTSGGLEVEWDDDFKAEVRSKASKECARALKTELQSF